MFLLKFQHANNDIIDESVADLDEGARGGGRNTNGVFRELCQINRHFPSEQNKSSMSF